MADKPNLTPFTWSLSLNLFDISSTSLRGEYFYLQETESGERIKQLLAQLSQSSQTLEDSEQREARFRAVNEEVTKLRADKARLEADLKAANQELGAQNLLHL